LPIRGATRLEMTWSDALDRVDAADYDRFVDEAPSGRHEQTRAWAGVATARQPLVTSYFIAREAGRVVGTALVLRPKGALQAQAGRVAGGPVTSDVSDLRRVTEALVVTARRRELARLTVTPGWEGEAAERAEASLFKAGFRPEDDGEGAETTASALRLHLPEDDEEEALAGSVHEAARRQLRIAAKAGALARRGDVRDLGLLQRLDEQQAVARGRVPRPHDYFTAIGANVLASRRRGALIVCDYAAEAVAALFVVAHGELATVVLDASTPSTPGFSPLAPCLMEAIHWAREIPCEALDLGEADPDGGAATDLKLDFADSRVRLVREHARLF
jgi:Acetyltransferase (GNAT) domain